MRPLSLSTFSLQSLSFSIYFPAALGGPLTFPLRRSASIESTQSEREFRRRHQAITHRMVHRKSSAIMYNKILERTFGEFIGRFMQFLHFPGEGCSLGVRRRAQSSVSILYTWSR